MKDYKKHYCNNYLGFDLGPGLQSWPILLQKHSLELLIFIIVFCKNTKILPPDDFLCKIAATGMSLFAREHAQELAI